MSSSLTISGDFPAADRAAWEEIVEKALKGRSASALDSKTEHGLPVQALYRDSDWRPADGAEGYPGMAPFTRGGSPTRDAWLPWDIRQMVRHPDPATAREEIFEALNNGVSSIELRLDADGENGCRISRTEQFTRLLDGVKLDLATLALDLIGSAVGSEAELAAIVAAAIPEADRTSALIAFNLDPIGAFARTGSCAGSPDDAVSSSMKVAKALAEAFPSASILRVDSRVVHEAGGTEVHELAYSAATFAAYMRAAIESGFDASAAATSTLFTVAVGADYHLEIPKLRAARKILGRVAEAFGAPGALRLQAVTSRRMLTARDTWTNLLRNTAACFAAGVGGADIVTSRTFTDAVGHAGPLARRMARNTQIIAQEESALGRVIDPPGGSWAFERLTDDMAKAAWSAFQEIEAKGGIAAALAAGNFQSEVGTARQARRTAVATRAEWITGVNDFPDLQEEVPPTAAATRLESSSAPPREPTQLGAGTLQDLMSAATRGATFSELAQVRATGDEAECDPLWPVRLSEPFEALRDLADRRREAGRPPRIFLAALGPLAEHSARLTFAKNFFAVGGIESVIASDPDLALGQAFGASDCELACICGADSRYALEAADAASQLKTAGAGRVYLAGKPGEQQEAFVRAGIDEFIHIGVDVIASLELAHAELGLT